MRRLVFKEAQIPYICHFPILTWSNRTDPQGCHLKSRKQNDLDLKMLMVTLFHQTGC